VTQHPMPRRTTARNKKIIFTFSHSRHFQIFKLSYQHIIAIIFAHK